MYIYVGLALTLLFPLQVRKGACNARRTATAQGGELTRITFSTGHILIQPSFSCFSFLHKQKSEHSLTY